MPRRGIHVFRKDLRVHDNLALNKLMKQVDEVIGVFIFDPAQAKNSSHFSPKAAQFLAECVTSLNEQCGKKLVVLQGNPASKLRELFEAVKPEAVSFNRDFTPYAVKRDRTIEAECKRLGIAVIADADDQTLAPVTELVKQDGSPYMSFGAFYKRILARKPESTPICWVKPRRVGSINSPRRLQHASNSGHPGGRAEALRRLSSSSFQNREDRMGALSSGLSAYLNLGCVSVREVYWKQRAAARSLAWRDFFLCIYSLSPHASEYGTFLDQRYTKLKWPRLDRDEWNRFIASKTGFLLVDAAMAELKATGFIGNRARLLLATFWIKYLLISPLDSQYGSQVGFSRLLVDCSACQNKMNHLWVLGDLDFAGRRFGASGAHPLTGRMIRVDNEMVKRYDPKLEYVSKWLPAFAPGDDLAERKRTAKRTVPMFEWRQRYNRYCSLYKNI